MDEFHKRSTQKKHLRQASKTRSRDERRLIKENSKGRRNGQSDRDGGRHWRHGDDEDEGGTGLQSMRPAPQLDLKAAKEKAAAGDRSDQQIQPHLDCSGLVLSVARSLATARGPAGDLQLQLSPDGPKPAVGDMAYWQASEAEHPRLGALGPRRTVLSRPDPHNPNRALVFAANVDIAVIVVSAKQPGFRPALIDRCLIAIEHGGAQPVICLNKVDLIDPHQREAMRVRLDVYQQLGCQVLMTSTETGEGVANLIHQLSGHTCVLIGHSGVGKSSLLNQIDPERERRTKSGREFDGKGRHTTTSSELVELADGTRLIDTPGVRTFGLWQIDQADLIHFFPDLAVVAADCRFRNCQHITEADCAIKSGLANGSLHWERWEAYNRISRSLSDC